MDKALKQLISIRQVAMEESLKDVMTLNQLVDLANVRCTEVEENHANFLGDIRHAEETGLSLTITTMIEHRRYLTRLRNICQDATRIYKEVDQQREGAQTAFNEKFKELKTLDRLAERRVDARHKEQLRRDYLTADDMEIMRNTDRKGGQL
jgi:flagellar export protein FliJ